MKLNEIADNAGARKKRMRVGRGIGAGKGKTGILRITGFADLGGKLTSIVVGDAGNVNVKGVFTGGGVKGPFTVTGLCG